MGSWRRAEASLFIDNTYKTTLGTAFCNRRIELNLLEELLSGVRTVVIYGPRGAGKSELARYYVARRLSASPLSRFLYRLVMSMLERILWRYTGGTWRAEPLEELASIIGVPASLVRLVEYVASRLGGPTLILLDEPHLLFGGDIKAALVELEAVAGYLAKRGEEKAKLLVTVSEGFLATLDAQARLQGYATEFTMVEHMDTEHFRALYREYREKYGCNIALNTVLNLAGTLPGYLPDLCHRSPVLLEEWIDNRLQQLEDALEKAAEAARVAAREAAEIAKRLLQGTPPRNLVEKKVAEKLVELNIAYPCPSRPRKYLPQLPIYAIALKQDMQLTLRQLEETQPPLRRCLEAYSP